MQILRREILRAQDVPIEYEVVLRLLEDGFHEVVVYRVVETRREKVTSCITTQPDKEFEDSLRLARERLEEDARKYREEHARELSWRLRQTLIQRSFERPVGFVTLYEVEEAIERDAELKKMRDEIVRLRGKFTVEWYSDVVNKYVWIVSECYSPRDDMCLEVPAVYAGFRSAAGKYILVHKSLINRPLVGVKVTPNRKGTAWLILPDGDYAVLQVKSTRVSRGRHGSEGFDIRCLAREPDIVLADLHTMSYGGGVHSHMIVVAVKMVGHARPVAELTYDSGTAVLYSNGHLRYDVEI